MPAAAPENAHMPTDETQVPAPPKRPPAGIPGKTPVITARAIIRMQDVREGDRILDRNGSWQPVTKVHKRRGDTVRVSGRGHAGIELSDDHPVLVRNASGDGAPGWLSAGMLTNQHTWATPTYVDPLPIPAGAPDSPAEWHLVGSYLRSGTVEGDKITIKAADRREAQSIRQHLTGWTGREDKGGGVTFEGHDREQARWLAEHFGDKAHTKTVPPWALGMDENHRRALLRGYYGPNWKPLPTTSPELVTGMGVVAETLGERTDIKPILARWRPTYQARKLEDGHGSRKKHSWLGNQQARRAIRQRQVVDLEVDGGAGGSFIVGIGSMVISAAGEKPQPKPDARSRAAAKPPATAARGGGGGGGSNGRSAQRPASKPRRMPSVASIADTLGSSVPMIGGRKPRPPQRNTVPLTPAQEQRVQQGIRSLDGVQRAEAVANATAVPQSARAREAARVAEDRLNQRGVSVAELEELRQVDALNKDIPGTVASSKAKHQGLVRQDVHDVLAAERPAREQRVIRDWGDATTINHLGKVTAEQFLPGHLAHPNGHPDPDAETALIVDPLVRMNLAGFATIGSQPGMANSVGYGGDIFHQNAAVEGFATPDTAQRIREAAEAEGLTVIQHSGAARRRDYSDIDRESDFGTHLSHSDVDLALGNGVNRSLRKELHSAEQIAVVDPDVGRNDRLERFAQRMDEQRRSDPINDVWMVDDLNGLPPGTTENNMRRQRGEAVPDLRDELRAPAERQERASRMAAAEQATTPVRSHAAEPERPSIADAPSSLPVDAPAHEAVGEAGFDKFARSAEDRGIAPTPEFNSGQTVVTRVDSRPVHAEIVDMTGADMAGMVGNRRAAGSGITTADRPRLAPGQAPLHVQDIATAAQARESVALPTRGSVAEWENVKAAMSARAKAKEAQPTTAAALRSTTDPRRTVYEHEVQSAAEARRLGLPVDREAFERNLDDRLNQVHNAQAGSDPTPAHRRKGLALPYERELPDHTTPRPAVDNNVPPELRAGLRRAGQGTLEERMPVNPHREEGGMAPERQRGLRRVDDAELPPPPVVDRLLSGRPAHDPDVLERHGLSYLADAERKPQVEDREPNAKPAVDAEERATDRPTDEPSRPEEPIGEDTQPAERSEPEPGPKPDPKPEREDMDRTAEPEPEPDVKPEPEKAKDPEPEPTPEPEPEREPRQWEKDAAEAVEPAHSDPEPAAPSHYMGPEL